MSEHYQQGSKNLRLTKSCYKISQEPIKKQVKEEKKRTGGNPKWSDEQIKLMRYRYEVELKKPREIAEEFGINRNTLYFILYGGARLKHNF